MISEHKILNVFAENVRFFRKKMKISQEELAFRTGIHKNYIGMIERAERNSTLVILEKISNSLGIGFDELLQNEKNEIRSISKITMHEW
ncbi:MAG: helix-turn-helix transcriptional regulator [Ignavibacteriales bacterium]|nr:helix-turn-helix transcriptional regulator [Ignavibacteriales bacterium]